MLAKIGCDPVDRPDDCMPLPDYFSTVPASPHPGLRAYPFLGQVLH